MSDFDQDPFDQQPEEYELVSKSEMKREMERWQELGEKLTELPESQWATLPITETLLAALKESKRIKQFGARKRHLNYIGRVMRDEDVDAIREQLELRDPSSELYGRRQKQLEMWRNRLVEDSQGLNDFIEQFPQVDRQQLRNLVRNAQKEVSGENGKPGKAYKNLFQFIKGEAE
ncbi:ribosome biogenesis factor YjgA [Oceanobacter mangrovi]|uniref:ribosome biogenesis factor YjgA n=1 Tax=Oceanobacter mangrovi TaxID=2862510 RepID=UPI001C8D3291|nr:ribosome biogenesis factor YjgA [Oceanobacter mangrovi]